MNLPNSPMKLAVSAFVFSVFLTAAQGPGAHRHMRMYDSATETTIKGTVESVKQGTRAAMMGMHLTLKASDEAVEVMLGPAAFVSSNGFTFAKGDQLTLTGSRIAMGAMEFIIAREVVKNGKTLTLRDDKGNPKWSPGMRGMPGRGAASKPQ